MKLCKIWNIYLLAIQNIARFFQTHKKVFSEHTTTLCDMYFGLTPYDVKELAYKCAIHYISVPESWKANKKAGEDWFSGFMKRNQELSIRCAEAISLARTTSFNKHNVASFFDKLGEVLSRYKINATNIWNLDETGITTVQKPRKVVARKGSR